MSHHKAYAAPSIANDEKYLLYQPCRRAVDALDAVQNEGSRAQQPEPKSVTHHERPPKPSPSRSPHGSNKNPAPL